MALTSLQRQALLVLAPVLAVAIWLCAHHEDATPTIAAAGSTPMPDARAFRFRSRSANANGKPPSVCTSSADCPAGVHCDLGECIADCDASRPCAAGVACSLRGRCGSDDEVPVAPNPQEELVAEPASILLPRSQRELRIRLTTASAAPVRYRIEVAGAHLSLKAPRGSFTNQTELVVDVDSTGLDGTVPGVVRIVSTIGEVSVAAPLLASVSAHYEGAIVYDGRPLPLGASNIVLDLRESSGKVSARIDPTRSMLFPSSNGRVATADGTYSAADRKMILTVVHRIEGTYGGERNYFARPLLRRTQVVLDEGAEAGTFEGAFSEEVQGLFASSVIVTGTMKLRARGAPSAFSASPIPPNPPPPAGVYLSPRDVFRWSGQENTCFEIIRASCSAIDGDDVAKAACVSDPPRFADRIMLATSKPLSKAAASANARYPALADACRTAIDATSMDMYTADVPSCGRPTPLSCLLEPIWNRGGDAGANSTLYAETVSRMLQPALLVAKDDVVEAVRSSIREGLIAESARYDTALARLRPAAQWALQPRVLEVLRSLDGAWARGGEYADSRPWGAAISIGELLSTTTRVSAELSRVAAAIDAGNQPNARRLAQERGLLAYFEGVAFASLLRSWTSAPPTLATLVAGTLGPIDRSFVALSTDDSYFGVARGFVPFLFNPNSVAPGRDTNFLQVLVGAQSAVQRAATTEGDFEAANHQYLLDKSALQHELSSVRTVFDSGLKEICGAKWVVADQVDWSTCGRFEQHEPPDGQLALLDARGAAAEGQLRVLQGRVVAKQNMIAVSEQTLQQVLQLKEDEIRFRLSTGQTIAVYSLTQGILRSVIEGLQIASQSQLWNLGIPAALAVPAIALGFVNNGIEYHKDQLRLAIEAKSSYTGLEETKLKGLEQLHREWIELAQLALEAEEGARALLVQEIERNTLGAKARSLFEERSRALAMIGSDPARDPTVRLVRDRAALDLLEMRAQAQRQLWLAARALAYETNTDLPGAEGAVLRATNASSLDRVAGCLKSIADDHQLKFGHPQQYVASMSVRRLVGILGDREDPVTKKKITAAEQFRLLLLQQRNMDPSGGVSLEFSTTLKPPRSNDPHSDAVGFFPSNICEDQIWTIQASVEGDQIQNDTALIELRVDDSNFMRSCAQRQVASWQLDGGRTAVIQAGVNVWGDATANSSLHGRAVAQSLWRLTIPPGSVAPANSALFAEHAQISDIRLRLVHGALAPATASVSIDCLGQP